jgi:LCP family protein required for cell wall assembly
VEGGYWMKAFWKVFSVSIVFFSIAIFLGSYSYLKVHEHRMYSNIDSENYKEENTNANIFKGKSENKEKSIENKTYSSLSEAFKDSDRINIIFLGMEDSRTDTIMLASFEQETKKVDIISIPRDTYIHRKGYDQAEQRKINAIYGDHGVGGVKKAVSYILESIPIHHYVMMDYKGVESIIDSIGGVEVVVPFHMKYKDPTANPPLNIDIKEGRQVLNGKESLEFLRYRKENNHRGGYIDGDLGRIKAQHEFLKSFIGKALSYRLPVVIRESFNNVKTDIKFTEGLAYSTNAMGIKDKDFIFKTLPGEGEFKRANGKLLSYFTYDVLETKKLLEQIYKVKPPKY